MKIYQKQDIDASFSRALDAMQSDSIDAKDLGVFFGSLSLSITMRIQQLKSGAAKSSSRDEEIKKLQEAEKCLASKINTGTVAEMSQEITAAYKVYGANV